MNNFISLNIKYLCDLKNLKQDEFGLLFNLNKGVIGTYVRDAATPKIEIIQKICAQYNISIDEFVNSDLSKGKSQNNSVNEPGPVYQKEVPSGFVLISEKHLKLLESTIEDKNKIIKALELRLGESDKSETA
ncbi:helix-turn-helix domain-containing protein [Flavobacterium fluviatile]|uniref:helix-turn-helix domain-containing protein n=1 Tax=Flavobacterium fluviatile TaxID=1862387 RepID=UPI0013D02F69|nr:helix-turn-helix transcriptional regulator [Flavobacterium fluviatile]